MALLLDMVLALAHSIHRPSLNFLDCTLYKRSYCNLQCKHLYQWFSVCVSQPFGLAHLSQCLPKAIRNMDIYIAISNSSKVKVIK